MRIILQATLEEQASMYREIMMISRDIMEQQVVVLMNKMIFYIAFEKIVQNFYRSIARYLVSEEKSDIYDNRYGLI